MLEKIGGKLQTELKIWRFAALPGLMVLTAIIIARLTGSLQLLEWITFDYFLRLRPPEPVDERIVIIGINEEDIEEIGVYPLPDGEIAQLIDKLQQYQPRAIGLDIVRNIPVPPGHDRLVKVFEENKNLIAIAKVLQPSIPPPPTLPVEQLGFSDTHPDQDGKYRRNLLGTSTPEGYKLSFSVRLAKMYLATEGITLENGIKDPKTMGLENVEIPRFLPNFGGYVKTDAGGIQTMVNFRSGKEIFRVLSFNDLKTDNFNPNWLKNKLILIGITAPSVPDFVNTSAIANLKPYGLAYGIEYQAHAISQIISAVKDDRPLIKTWSEIEEYVWIILWGFLAIALGRLTQSAVKNLFAVGIASIALVTIAYSFLWWGFWIPVAPVLLILAANGVGLSAFAFYEYDRALKAQIAVQENAIKTAFTEIHNGPLQTLAIILKNIQDTDLPKEELVLNLKALNSEIREISNELTENARNLDNIFHLGSGKILDLKSPIHELFFDIYTTTLERSFPYFQTLKVRVRDFAPINSEYLNTELKRELCHFLEEALCNVGKHAQGVTRITAIGQEKDGYYILTIQDNGIGLTSLMENKGTKQSQQLAQKLRGKFKRESLSPKGTLCELTWRLAEKNKLLKILLFLVKD